MKTEKILNKIPFYKLPFRFKLFWAKCFIRMFKGFGETFDNDIILFNELSKWIETNGRPTTSNINYWRNKL
jgi:hypothetical protein